MNHGMNLKPGINYCAPVGPIGFRGVSDGWARLIPLSDKSKLKEEIFFFYGVDVPADLLPYLPDMGPDSAFENQGHWHHYEISGGIFIAHLIPKDDTASSFTMRQVLQTLWFKGEESPRVFLDMRSDLLSEGVLVSEDLQTIKRLLAAKRIVIN